jgi:hypothetical protein
MNEHRPNGNLSCVRPSVGTRAGLRLKNFALDGIFMTSSAAALKQQGRVGALFPIHRKIFLHGDAFPVPLGLPASSVDPRPQPSRSQCVTSTPGWHNLAPSEDVHAAMLSGVEQVTPLGRMADPDVTAAAALFLASDDSSFVNGSELFVDGRRLDCLHIKLKNLLDELS